MNIFKRIFRIGQAEIHAAVERMEDPIKMTEEGLRELRDDVSEATDAYARVKAIAIRTENERTAALNESEACGQKAILVMQQAQQGIMPVAKAEALALEALSQRRQLMEDATSLERQVVLHQQSAADVLRNVEVLKDNLAKWERELKTLKTRMIVSKTTEHVNRHLAHIDDNTTIAMLEKMKSKAESKDRLAGAPGDVAGPGPDIKQGQHNNLNKDSHAIEHDLEAIKRQLGIIPR